LVARTTASVTAMENAITQATRNSCTVTAMPLSSSWYWEASRKLINLSISCVRARNAKHHGFPRIALQDAGSRDGYWRTAALGSAP